MFDLLHRDDFNVALNNGLQALVHSDGSAGNVTRYITIHDKAGELVNDGEHALYYGAGIADNDTRLKVVSDCEGFGADITVAYDDGKEDEAVRHACLDYLAWHVRAVKRRTAEADDGERLFVLKCQTGTRAVYIGDIAGDNITYTLDPWFARPLFYREAVELELMVQGGFFAMSRVDFAEEAKTTECRQYDEQMSRADLSAGEVMELIR